MERGGTGWQTSDMVCRTSFASLWSAEWASRLDQVWWTSTWWSSAQIPVPHAIMHWISRTQQLVSDQLVITSHGRQAWTRTALDGHTCDRGRASASWYFGNMWPFARVCTYWYEPSDLRTVYWYKTCRYIWSIPCTTTESAAFVRNSNVGRMLVYVFGRI